MTYYTDESEAINDFETIAKEFISVPAIMVYERNPKDESVDEIILGIKVKPKDIKTMLLIKALKNFHITSEKSMQYHGTKLDVISEVPIEYVFVHAVVMS